MIFFREMFTSTVEPRFNELPRDLDIPNLHEDNQNVYYIEVKCKFAFRHFHKTRLNFLF